MLIDVLTGEIKNDVEKNQGKLINIEEETLMKMKACFQEMVCQILFNNIQIFAFIFR